MIATLRTQEQVDRIARDLAPDVVRIRLDVTTDWTGDPALYFRVTLSDEASRRRPLRDVTGLVRAQVAEELRLEGERKLRDLVEEDRSAVGLLEEALAIAVGAAERPPDMSKELALD